MSSTNPPDLPLQSEVTTPETTSFADILSEFERSHQPEAEARREALQGTVVTVSADSVVVDIGRKMEGVLPIEGFKNAAGEPAVKPGDTVMVAVTGRGEGGYYQLSTVTVKRPKDWSSLEQAFADGCAIGGVVSEVVKGGLRVDVGVSAFMPASRSGAKDAAEMEKLIGQEIQCKIIKLDVADEDVVVDRRAILEQEETRARQKVFEDLAEGEVRQGTVRSLTDFGAFVDLGGVDGLLHVTDMSWARVAKPSDLLSAGDHVEVKILKINRQTRRVSLGMKQLSPDPWSLAAEKCAVGSRVRGKVTRLADFGAFVELEPGVEGLIHLSEMSWSKKQRKPAEILKSGEVVEVLVLSVNTADRRMGLGLKQVLGDPWDEVGKKYPAGMIVEGSVGSLTKFGAFIELEDGIEGMIHIADITSEKRLDHPKDALKQGQTVRAVVLEADKGRRRIRLGMKQLEPTTADEYIAEHRVGEVVTGRLVDVGRDTAKAEVAEGVYASCRISKPPAETAEDAAGRAAADLSSLTAMLSSKWKQGKAMSSSKAEPPRAGQVRTFRIVAMDPQQKRIEVELAS